MIWSAEQKQDFYYSTLVSEISPSSIKNVKKQNSLWLLQGAECNRGQVWASC